MANKDVSEQFSLKENDLKTLQKEVYVQLHDLSSSVKAWKTQNNDEAPKSQTSQPKYPNSSKYQTKLSKYTNTPLIDDDSSEFQIFQTTSMDESVLEESTKSQRSQPINLNTTLPKDDSSESQTKLSKYTNTTLIDDDSSESQNFQTTSLDESVPDESTKSQKMNLKGLIAIAQAKSSTSKVKSSRKSGIEIKNKLDKKRAEKTTDNDAGHSSNLIFKCSICKECYKTKRLFQIHQKYKHGTNLIQCEKCNSTFAKQNE